MSWLPLESNPEIMNKYLSNLGVPNKWRMVDIYGLEPELLALVPTPVLSVLLLFPCSPKYEQHKLWQETEIVEKGQIVSPSVYYVKQMVPNACGTIALIHSVANNMDRIQLGHGHLKQFIEDTILLTPEERGKLMQKAQGIITTHRELALEGQTEAPDSSDPVNFHFVAFIEKDGYLYELDGRKSFPVNHGQTSKSHLLQDAARVCKEYMARDPDELHFTVVALSAV